MATLSLGVHGQGALLLAGPNQQRDETNQKTRDRGIEPCGARSARRRDAQRRCWAPCAGALLLLLCSAPASEQTHGHLSLERCGCKGNEGGCTVRSHWWHTEKKTTTNSPQTLLS